MSDAMKIHGTIHAARTCLLVAILANMEGLPEKETYALMVAAVVHDLGRTNGSTDAKHGERSVDEIRKLDMDLLNAVVCFHSRGDRTFESNPYKKYIALFKDADALDRARTGDLKSSHLRTASAATLVDDAERIYKWTLNILGK